MVEYKDLFFSYFLIFILYFCLGVRLGEWKWGRGGELVFYEYGGVGYSGRGGGGRRFYYGIGYFRVGRNRIYWLEG